MDCEVRFFVCRSTWPRTHLLLSYLRHDRATDQEGGGRYDYLLLGQEHAWFSPLSEAERHVIRMLGYDFDVSTLDGFGIFPHRSLYAACQSFLRADIRNWEAHSGHIRFIPGGLPYGGPDGLLSLLAAMGHIVHYVREVGLERTGEIEIFGRPPTASPFLNALRASTT